jgi:S-DNA-T family DNA segregation ATPase FtsK/SpoIIIE
MKPAPPASPPAARAAPLVAPFLSPFETGGSDDDLDDDAPLPGVPAISKPVPVPASLAGPRIRPPPTPASATAREIVESREPRRLLLPTIVPFELPGLGLLENPSPGTRVVDESELRRQAARLEECLRHYAVEGRVTDILPGPVVTMFEFEPAPGIKVARIANLENDLALALRAVKVRIVAPIPGKGAVGIEVPSAARETVYLREIMGSAAFRRPGLRLPLALGKAIDGTAVSADMAKMPHLLVAGTTGSGKSVCVNSIILSLVYARRPDEVRLILVDPKMLEFSIYDGIPHLLVPVVTSPKKAAMALRWAVEEMGRRYRVLAAMNTRNIVNYNEKAEKLQAEWLAWDASCRAGKPIDKPDCGRAAGEDTIVYRSEGGDPVGPPDKMPYIVIIIDELADLMMVARKEVEESIVRLAQMARAAGLHLLLATQRPSVDVITGLIKANFPTRLSFQVRSKIDSRTVLDANGAENLLGMGDGLYLPAGASDPVRVHGAFVNDDEVKRVVDHLKDQGEPEYVDQVLAATEGEEDEDGESADGEEDDMYDQALAVVAEAGKASTSLLQRRLKLGYNRAARIIDTMEKRGVVGPADGARPRDVYVKPYDT